MELKLNNRELDYDRTGVYDKNLIMLWYKGNWYFFREKASHNAKKQGDE